MPLVQTVESLRWSTRLDEAKTLTGPRPASGYGDNKRVVRLLAGIYPVDRAYGRMAMATPLTVLARSILRQRGRAGAPLC